MQLIHIALRKPYTFVVLAILIVLFGVQTTVHMPTDVFPNILIPVTSVVWAYDGLLPQDVEGRITYIFERFLTSTVEGIKRIVSHSYYGSSIINVYLQDGIDRGGTEADIAAISQTVVKALPPDISPPMVMRLAPSSVPVAMLQVTSDTLTMAELYNLCIMRIRPLLVTIDGAILPHPYGGQDMQIMVSLDQQKLLARHLTPSDVHLALGSQNLVLPGGDIKIKATDWIVLTNASPLKVEDFNNIPIKREGNAFIHLRDVADVRLAGRVQTNAVLVDGQQSVIIIVMKSSEASTLDVVDGIKEMIPRIEKIVPDGVKVKLLNDASIFVTGFDRGCGLRNGDCGRPGRPHRPPAARLLAVDGHCGYHDPALHPDVHHMPALGRTVDQCHDVGRIGVGRRCTRRRCHGDDREYRHPSRHEQAAGGCHHRCLQADSPPDVCGHISDRDRVVTALQAERGIRLAVHADGRGDHLRDAGVLHSFTNAGADHGELHADRSPGAARPGGGGGPARRNDIAERLRQISAGIRTRLRSLPRPVQCAARTGRRPSQPRRHRSL